MKYSKIKCAGLDVLEVKGDKNAPSIMLLHGFGANAYDLLGLADICQENPKPNWYFPQGIDEVELAPGYFGRAWFEIDLNLLQKAVRENKHEEMLHAFPKDLTKVRSNVQTLIEELDIPLSKLFLGGFSQGAILATDIALNMPANIAGLLVLSGTLYHQNEWQRLLSAHRGLHFFQSHGTQDPILPYKGAEALEKLFKEERLEGHLDSFHGGHDIPQSILHKLHLFLKKRIG